MVQGRLPWMAPSEVPQMLTQAVLGRALGRTVLAHDPTRPPLRHPEPRLEPLNGYAAAVRGHHFPSASFLSIALSNSASANNFFNRAFSAASSLSRRTSLALIPA